MNNPFSVSATEFRIAISQACQVTDTIGDPGKVADALVTYSHAKALDYRTAVVRGGRGSGKSFWWSALQREAHRNWITESLGAKLQTASKLRVLPGFGVATDERYPTSRSLVDLADLHAEHLEDIWTTILLTQVLPPDSSPYASYTTWKQRVAWTATHIEEAELLVRQASTRLEKENAHLLIVFDGLDRLAATWDRVRPLARSILRFALQIQSYPHVRAKVFLRPDMFEDPGITAFPDSSKLMDSYASLDWSPLELFALFFQRIANSDNAEVGESFRGGAELILRQSGTLHTQWGRRDEVWALPFSLRREQNAQREVFHSIAGQAMSHNQDSVKRGYPYTWLPNHLADSHGEVSPRSFLAALREAAQVEPPHNFGLPLYFTGIQKGVSRASQTRVNEITEDFPWVRKAMEGLNGEINVPCDEQELYAIWSAENVLESIRNMDLDPDTPKVGPTDLGSTPLIGLLDNLVRLGIFAKQKGARIQMPDVYRVAFGIGRKGGIPPIRQIGKRPVD